MGLVQWVFFSSFNLLLLLNFIDLEKSYSLNEESLLKESLKIEKA